MEAEDKMWKDRCERYFSSITESDDNVKRKLKTKEKESEWKEIGEIQGEQQSNSVSDYSSLKKWIQVVDMHGWTFAGTTSNRIEGVISIAISLIMCGAVGFLVYLNVTFYIHQPSYFKMISNESKPSESVSFIICNKNLLRKSAISTSLSRFKNLANLDNVSFSSPQVSKSPVVSAQELLENSPLWSLMKNELPHQKILKYLSEFDEDFLPYSYMANSEDFASLYASSLKDGDVVLRYAVRPTKKDLRDYGHHRDKMFVHCWDGRRKCTDKYLTEIQDPEFGNCVRFTPEGIKTGTITLTLNAEPKDVINEMTSSPGFVFVIGQSGENMGDSLYSLAPGFSHFLNIKKKTTTVRKSVCNSEDCYEEKNCLYDCLDAKISKYCKCRYAYDVSSSTQCKMNVKFEYTCVRVIEALYFLQKLGCSCQPKCRTSHLTADFSSTPWPSVGHTKYLQEFLKQNGLNMTSSSIRNSLSKIEVNFRHLLEETVEESSDMSLLELLSRVGGASALLVGVSLLTAIELLWLLVRACIVCCYKLCNRSSQQEIIRLSESEITSVTWQAYKRRRREETGLPVKNGFIPNQPLRRNDSRHSRHSKRSILSPIAEENRKSSKENHKKEDNFEEKLYAKPWDRTGHNRAYNNVISSSKTGGAEFPIFNSLDEIPVPHVQPRCSTPDNSEHGNSRMFQMNGGNGIMYPYKPGRIVTPADAIQMYGKSASKYYCSEPMFL